MRVTNRKLFLLLLFIGLFCVGRSVGQKTLRLSPLFSDGAVLQQKSMVPVFGSADPGSRIEVRGSWSGRKFVTYSDSTGRFVAWIRTPKAGGPYWLRINDQEIKQVMIGEVWICSGQSNMQFELASSDLSEVHGEENSQIRIFTVPIRSAKRSLEMLDGGQWRYGAVDSIKNRVSAVAYYFARRLQQELGVPIGILSSSRGATAAEEWLNPDLFMQLDSSVRARYLPPDGRHAGCWYNAMIQPLLPYKVSGVIWYQGENNTDRPETYYSVMKKLIQGWRSDFRDSALPFYLVELAPYSQNWSRFRLVQQAIADQIPHCGFVSILDVGDLANIHPVNKFPVGDRLGQLVLANCYGKNFRSQVPRFRRAKSERDGLRLFFNHVGEGLVSTCGNDGSLFEIAGEDGVFCPCTMKIEGKTLLLQSAEVPNPRYARYFLGNMLLRIFMPQTVGLWLHFV